MKLTFLLILALGLMGSSGSCGGVSGGGSVEFTPDMSVGSPTQTTSSGTRLEPDEEEAPPPEIGRTAAKVLRMPDGSWCRVTAEDACQSRPGRREVIFSYRIFTGI